MSAAGAVLVVDDDVLVRDVVGRYLGQASHQVTLAGNSLDRVFDVAYRGNTARTPAPAEESGAGLGLAIARGLVEAHSGRIEARNHGTGCRFEILLPLAPE